MSTQSEALRLAQLLRTNEGRYLIRRDEAATELERLHRHELALNEWLRKTEWVQATAQAGELGQHRADAIKQRFGGLHSLNQELLEALCNALPYVEDVLANKEQLACFKPGVVQAHAKAIRAAIAKAEGQA